VKHLSALAKGWLWLDLFIDFDLQAKDFGLYLQAVDLPDLDFDWKGHDLNW